MAKSKKVRISKGKKGIILGAVVLIGIASAIIFATGIFKGNGDSDNVNNKENNTNTDSSSQKKTLQIIDVNSQSRPYAVMINNINVARPYQSGLQDAYIIYEMIVEGGITRYLALFKDQTTERIGTIRSSRHYYLDYALENDAIYVHWGWSPQAQSDIKTLGVNNINGLIYSTKYFWKDTSLKVATEHTAYTSMEKLIQAANDLKYRTKTNKDTLLNYSIDEIEIKEMENATVANHISINYSKSITSTYEYDSENKVYNRSVNGTAHIDYVTKKQYTFKNIITYQVNNYTLNDAENKGRQGIDNIGKGTGYYITEGYAIPIKWEKESRTSQTKYYFEDGKELKVNDGNTFIQIQPVGKELSIM